MVELGTFILISGTVLLFMILVYHSDDDDDTDGYV